MDMFHAIRNTGYNAILISTIVDESCFIHCFKNGYNAILISTIVDMYCSIRSDFWAIMLF